MLHDGSWNFAVRLLELVLLSGVDSARVRRKREDSIVCRVQYTLDEAVFDIQYVRELAPSVQLHRPQVRVDLVHGLEAHGRRRGRVQRRRHADDTRCWRPRQSRGVPHERQETIGEKKVPEMVHCEMAVDAVRGDVVLVDTNAGDAEKLRGISA